MTGFAGNPGWITVRYQRNWYAAERFCHSRRVASRIRGDTPERVGFQLVDRR